MTHLVLLRYYDTGFDDPTYVKLVPATQNWVEKHWHKEQLCLLFRLRHLIWMTIVCMRLDVSYKSSSLRVLTESINKTRTRLWRGQLLSRLFLFTDPRQTRHFYTQYCDEKIFIPIICYRNRWLKIANQAKLLKHTYIWFFL